jgi:hypothetical protein
MKLTYKEKEYELKYSFRGLMIYENIMKKSFQPQNLTDIIILFYSTLLAAAKDEVIKYDEFLDWLDENPNELNRFSNFLMEVFGLNQFITPEKETTEDKKSDSSDPKNL